MRLLTELEEVVAENSSPIYRCAYCPEGRYPLPGDPSNLYDLLRTSATQHPERPALGRRQIRGGAAGDYEFQTYGEVGATSGHVGAALRSLGVGRGGGVGVYSSNCVEWMLLMKGIDWAGGVTVPLYDSFGPEAVRFIIEHSGLSVIGVASDKLATLAEVLPHVQGQVVQVVVWSAEPGVDLDAALLQEAEAAGVPITRWERFVAFGESNPGEPSLAGPDELCTIMYTSGTTGEPKGVEISHRAVLSTVAALLALLHEWHLDLGPEDVFLSYLPLAHIFDRVAEEAFLCLGASIGYWQGSPKKLMDDLAALRPTIFVGVPRIFDRIYSAFTDKMSKASWPARALVGVLWQVKQLFVSAGVCAVTAVDALAFRRIASRLGNRQKVIVSGGAPLAGHVEEFLKVAMCCPVTQGYGLTETCGASFIANPFDGQQALTVGAPVVGLDVRLESIPEMGYEARGAPPQGEVLLRGPAVFSAYHKRPDLTDEVKGQDGWFRTGDVGEFTAAGALRIIDRKKNFFKLAHGEYVAAEKIENVCKKHSLVDQVWVYGESSRASLVAVVAPDEGALLALGRDAGVSGPFKEVCGSAEVRRRVQKALEAEGRRAGLKGFEIVRRIHLTPEAFSVENDLMTPSFKLKRPQLKKRFSKEIEALYSGLD